jgi:hypothetical protein
VAGTITFPITTTNMGGGTYTAALTDGPTGVSVQGNVTISGGSGTLTLAGNTSTILGMVNGVYSNIKVTLTGSGVSVTSSPFTIVISPPGAAKSVTLGTQVGTLKQGTAGSVTFPVTTANITNGTYTPTVNWFLKEGDSFVPTIGTARGVSVTIGAVSGNAATATVTTTILAAAGDRHFTITIDGIQSNVATLTIGAP